MRRAVLALALCASPSLAKAAPPAAIEEVAFDVDDALTRIERADAQALAALEAWAQPGDPTAAQALFDAARRLREPTSGLPDLPGARRLYQRIVRDHPNHAVARAAIRWLAQLDTQLGVDATGDVWPAHAVRATALAALRQRPGPPSAATLAEAAALANADWPGADDAALWLADVLRDQAACAQARPWYAQVRSRATGDTGRAARFGAAICAARDGDFAQARALAAELDGGPAHEAALVQALRDDITAIEQRQRWRRVAIGGVMLGLLGLLASLTQATRNARRFLLALAPTSEVKTLLPIAVVLVTMAYTGHVLIGPAVLFILGAGVIATWLSSAGLRAAHPLTLRRVAVHMLAAGALVLGATYLALVHQGLIELVIETLRSGPEP